MKSLLLSALFNEFSFLEEQKQSKTRLLIGKYLSYLTDLCKKKKLQYYLSKNIKLKIRHIQFNLQMSDINKNLFSILEIYSRSRRQATPLIEKVFIYHSSLLGNLASKRF